MSSSVFSCDERIDVAFIPFMPATAQDKVEIRVQIRTEVKDALLDTDILVDGVPIHSAANVSVKDFYFFKGCAKKDGQLLVSIEFILGMVNNSSL